MGWFNFSKDSETASDLVLYAPISGIAMNIEEVPDVVFSEKVVGNGIAIKPNVGKLQAPCDAVVTQIFKTNHAIVLKSLPHDLEIFIHIGIDTLDLGKNDIFNVAVQEGDKVKLGDTLIEFNLALLQKRIKSIITPMVISAKHKNDIADLVPITNHCTAKTSPVIRVNLTPEYKKKILITK